MQASCHCGDVTVELLQPIDLVTSCNCSMCYRYGAVWAYFSPQNVKINSIRSNTKTYSHGDKLIDFHHCACCGCITHYTPTELGNADRMAVNLRMFKRDILEQVNIRYFDGADSWTFYEPNATQKALTSSV
ncbi:GFA family protein [Pseudoalteromonas phenolica]|uniref:Aldehyde-activating protein n=1 Tax=Pseudoalteromonas phenolica TaxID=161398 RepID=A0A0S2K6Y0_9GAMM|nr:aldehyde-activating protein [Pseudoalteromonas phenolica]ALO44045.1 Aldehyde-activating protein [Pseudoalteromonas phenolica]